MNREALIQEKELKELYHNVNKLHHSLGKGFADQYKRSLPFNDELFDRWERAKKLNFGQGSSIYDSSYVFGDVRVGKNTWIGPFSIIDGSGGLYIGDHCTISSGVHIYSHDNVEQTLTGGKAAIERAPVRIGNCTYIGPNAIIKKGISIGNESIIGAGSFVNEDIPSNSVAVGTPAKIIGKTNVNEGKLSIEYFTSPPNPLSKGEGA